MKVTRVNGMMTPMNSNGIKTYLEYIADDGICFLLYFEKKKKEKNRNRHIYYSALSRKSWKIFNTNRFSKGNIGRFFSLSKVKRKERNKNGQKVE